MAKRFPSTKAANDGQLSGVRPDPWDQLRRYTPARIALGRAGVSLPTRAVLEFDMAHACARDAVHHRLDAAALREALGARGHATLEVASAAGDRQTYLRRPDLGRRLDADSRPVLDRWRAAHRDEPDLVLVLADGLSALALEVPPAPPAASPAPATTPSLVEPIWPATNTSTRASPAAT